MGTSDHLKLLCIYRVRYCKELLYTNLHSLIAAFRQVFLARRSNELISIFYDFISLLNSFFFISFATR